MPKPKPLTKARLAALHQEVTRARLRALSRGGGEHTPDGRLRMSIGLESALSNLVGDLCGIEAVNELHEVLGRDISPAEVAAFKAEEAARQQTYIDRAAAAAPVTRAGA